MQGCRGGVLGTWWPVSSARIASFLGMWLCMLALPMSGLNTVTATLILRHTVACLVNHLQVCCGGCCHPLGTKTNVHAYVMVGTAAFVTTLLLCTMFGPLQSVDLPPCCGDGDTGWSGDGYVLLMPGAYVLQFYRITPKCHGCCILSVRRAAVGAASYGCMWILCRRGSLSSCHVILHYASHTSFLLQAGKRAAELREAVCACILSTR